MQISQSDYTVMKMIMIPISDFQEVIFLDMETLPKLVFTTFGTFANFYRPIVNFNKLWFFAQNLGKLKL